VQGHAGSHTPANKIPWSLRPSTGEFFGESITNEKTPRKLGNIRNPFWSRTVVRVKKKLLDIYKKTTTKARDNIVSLRLGISGLVSNLLTKKITSGKSRDSVPVGKGFDAALRSQLKTPFRRVTSHTVVHDLHFSAFPKVKSALKILSLLPS
jgi:hypothetical protein